MHKRVVIFPIVIIIYLKIRAPVIQLQNRVLQKGIKGKYGKLLYAIYDTKICDIILHN